VLYRINSFILHNYFIGPILLILRDEEVDIHDVMPFIQGQIAGEQVD
jgi:hypothetical protein